MKFIFDAKVDTFLDYIFVHYLPTHQFLQYNSHEIHCFAQW